MATPIAISNLPLITDLAETDLMLGVDLAQPVGTQTGQFEVGKLTALTAVGAFLNGSRQVLTAGAAVPITGWTVSGSNFMTADQGTGAITAEQDGYYMLTCMLVTDLNANNASLELWESRSGAPFVEVGVVSASDVLATISLSMGTQMVAGDSIRMGISAVNPGTAAITLSNFTMVRVV